MDDRPETRYVAVGDADVAYQVVGDGPVDVLYFYGLGSHIELFWDDPEWAGFLTGLASFSRLIFFDRRGTGASDDVPRNAMPTWEEWSEDIGAVLDTNGSKQPAIVASLDAGPIALLFAATHPERVGALVLLNTAARFLVADDYPIGATEEAVETIVETIRAWWGRPEFSAITNPNLAGNSERLGHIARVLRAAATPRTAAAQFRYILFQNDVRDALAFIHAPTLVLHVRDNPLLPIGHGRYLAEHIEGATLIELPGGDLGPTSSMYSVVDEVAEFLTGARPEVEVERILTTVLFSDIVGSTQLAAALGDQRWRSLLDAHDRTVRDQLRRFRGRRSTPPATVSSRRSTVRHEPFAAPRPSTKPPGSSTSNSGSGCTPANAKSEATTSPGCRYTSPLASARWPAPPKSWCRGWSRTW